MYKMYQNTLKWQGTEKIIWENENLGVTYHAVEMIGSLVQKIFALS